jgi:hypothetical protein
VDVLESDAVVEGESANVLLGYGEGKFAEAAGSEISVAITEKMLANAVAAIFREGADLRDVSYVVTHAGTEQDSDASVSRAVEGYERRGGVEDSAAGEAHDVVEEAERAGDGAVLVVDVAVNVSAVCRGNDVGSRLIVGFGPAMNFNVRRKQAGGLRIVVLNGQIEEETAIATEAFVQKWCDKVTGGMDEELGFDTMETGRLLERADGVAEQLEFDTVATVTSGVGVFDVQVTDDALGSLIDEKAVAVDESALNGGEAGEDSGVGVTKNHVGRGAVIPMESASPDGDFLLEE